MSEQVPYQVAWRWRHEGEGGTVKHDDVQASTATRAMAKVFAALAEEYAITRRDVDFLEVYRI